jgi:hypothetical protein
MDWLGELKAKRARIDDLAAQITELAGHLNATNYRFLCLIGEDGLRHGGGAHAEGGGEGEGRFSATLGTAR